MNSPFDLWSFLHVTTLRSQHVVFHDYVDAGAEGENSIGVAYILMDWLDGSHMKPWSLTEPPIKIKHHVLNQIADIMLNMLLKNPIDGDILFYGIHRPTNYTAQ